MLVIPELRNADVYGNVARRKKDADRRFRVWYRDAQRPDATRTKCNRNHHHIPVRRRSEHDKEHRPSCTHAAHQPLQERIKPYRPYTVGTHPSPRDETTSPVERREEVYMQMSDAKWSGWSAHQTNDKSEIHATSSIKDGNLTRRHLMQRCCALMRSSQATGGA